MSDENMSALVDALRQAQQDIGHATMDGSNPHYKSEYATLRSVIDTAKAALNPHGILFQQHIHPAENAVAVETVLMGHGATLLTGIVTVPMAKIDAHGFGSSLSYARRYSLSLAVGIFQKDDDGESAMVRGQYQLTSVDGKVVLADVNTTTEFLNACRNHLGKGPSVKDLYDANRWVIKKAQNDAIDEGAKQTLDGLNKMINVFEQEEQDETLA